MSGLMCLCGHRIGTSECPSPYNIMVYYKSEIDDALSLNPNILVLDFLEDWDPITESSRTYMHRQEPVFYYRCPKCKRVYEVQAKPGGRWLRVFKLEKSSFDNNEHDGWKQIYVLTDIETDKATEENPNITLEQFLNTHNSREYFISPDETRVIEYNGNVITNFVLEDSWSELR